MHIAVQSGPIDQSDRVTKYLQPWLGFFELKFKPGELAFQSGEFAIGRLAIAREFERRATNSKLGRLECRFSRFKFQFKET